MKYFDAHTHVQFDAYHEDRDVLLSRMQDEGVGALVVGVDLDSSRKAVALAQTWPTLWASVGLHPNDTPEEIFDIDTFRDLAKNPKVVAIGECGLDNYRSVHPDEDKPRQRSIFVKHVELALEANKPLMIHVRPTKGTMDSYRDLIEMLRSYKQEYGDKLRGDVHFFVGGVEEASALIGLGFTLSFTAVLTFARDYDDVVKYVPLSSILSETDAPYIAPLSRRGTRNDSFAVRDVVRQIADIRGEDLDMVRETLLANARRVFGLSAA